jgi:hypothetical protein
MQNPRREEFCGRAGVQPAWERERQTDPGRRQATRHFGADSDDSSIGVSRDLMGYAVRACVWQFMQVRTIDE